MRLKVINSGSYYGNCYFLGSEKSALLLDCGCKYEEIMKSVDLSIVKGVLITHEHGDHIQGYRKLKKTGIKAYGNSSVVEKLKKVRLLEEVKLRRIGGFNVTPFSLPHTTQDKETGCLIPCENYGYLIGHPDLGVFLYATDFGYIEQDFKQFCIRTMLIECNHMDEIEDAPNKEHVIQGHSSLSAVVEFIKKNQTDELKNVVLCHLSRQNADEKVMVETIKKTVGGNVNVYVAHSGLDIEV